MGTITINILRTNGHAAPGKFADAELHFTGGEFDDLKLVAFVVWRRRDGRGRDVNLPARRFIVLGGRRSFSLLRWIAKRDAQERLNQLMLGAGDFQLRHSSGPVRE